MAGVSIPAHVETRLNWDYRSADMRLRELYQQAVAAQWNPTMIDWSIEVEFGAPLPDGSAMALGAFTDSPFRRRGRAAWDRFRWEMQTWTVSQFLHGEQGALVGAARLAEMLPSIDGKTMAASQAADEARHIEVFARYLTEKAPASYPVSPPLASLLNDALRDPRWEVTALGIHLVIEPLALATFRLSEGTFHDELIRMITRLVARDEARHEAFGVVLLRDRHRELTEAERREREDFVVEAAALMSRRFEMDDVWSRLEVDLDEGRRFAMQSPTMVSYRQTLFTKVVIAISRSGLLSSRVLASLDQMGLVGAAARRAVARGEDP